MPRFLNAFVIREAVKDLSASAAKDRYFEFLILKRTMAIAGESNVIFAESNPPYKQAITELGAVNDEISFEFRAENRYINVFDTGDRTKGYRAARFISNGPNTTVGGTSWQTVVRVDGGSRPRKISLATDYLNYLENFLLKKTGNKPSLQAFAVWFLRHKDLDNLGGSIGSDSETILQEIVSYTKQSLELNQAEINILFDDSETFGTALLSRYRNDFVLTTVQKDVIYLPEVPDVRQLQQGTKNFSRKAKDELGAHNKIFYGAPGTGKSKHIDCLAESFDNYNRVTFYPDYSYSQFVGTYKPKSLYAVEDQSRFYEENVRENDAYIRRPVIDYVVVPGPFLSTLVQAYKNDKQNSLLIIEEINRASAAAVFGDVFQLLDRDENGVSEYSVTLSAELSNWMRGQGIEPDGKLVEASGDGLSVRLPSNFYIWATMNSADQGVLPLDSAFKRRWSFEYIHLNKGQTIIEKWTIKLLGREVSWDGLRVEINNFLLGQSGIGRSIVSEDKLLGPFFIKQKELSDDRAVLNKLLLYLRDDLVRHNPNVIFSANALHFSKVYDTYTTILSSHNSATDSKEKFGQDLAKLFAPALAERLTTLYVKPSQNAPTQAEPVE